MNWIELSTLEILDALVEKSFSRPVLIYKHSTSCAFSSVVRSRLEHAWSKKPLNIDSYFLNVITHRQLSNGVAEMFQVEHQSPQILIIINGICVFHDSHFGVNHQAIQQAITPVNG